MMSFIDQVPIGDEDYFKAKRFWRQSNSVTMCNKDVKLNILQAKLGHSSVSKIGHIKFIIQMV